MAEQQEQDTYVLYGTRYPFTGAQRDLLGAWEDRVATQVLGDDLDAVARQLVRLGVPRTEAVRTMLAATVRAVDTAWEREQR